MTDIDKLAREIVAADYDSKGFPEVAKSIRDGFDGFDLDIHAARLGIEAGMKMQRERDAVILDNKAAMYRAKAAKRDPFADDAMNPHDLSNELAVGMEYAAAAIRTQP